MKEYYSTFEFHYASISLAPYKGDIGTSSSLLKDIVKMFSNPELAGEKKIIDRHKNRKDAVPRRLVNISSRMEPKGLRCFGKMALIKNKAPKIWGGEDIIEEIIKEENKRFIEVTNYTIHFNVGSDPIIMFEFNSEGPRLSDIEFYIRQIARDYRMSKNIKTILHLYSDYDVLDREIANVFGLTVKVNTANINKLDWHKDLKYLENDSGFKDIRLEFFYKRVKENGRYEPNVRGLDFARNIISWLKKSDRNIEYVDDLKMTYQSEENDDIIDLDFLKNKKTSLVKVLQKKGETYTPADFKFIVGQVFNHYLTTGQTTNHFVE